MTPTTLEQARKYAEEVVGNYDTARVILTLADEIEALTKERDEYKQRTQRLMTTLFETKKERDALAAAAKLALDSIVELRYSNATHAADTISDRAIRALKKAGVQ